LREAGKLLIKCMLLLITSSFILATVVTEKTEASLICEQSVMAMSGTIGPIEGECTGTAGATVSSVTDTSITLQVNLSGTSATNLEIFQDGVSVYQTYSVNLIDDYTIGNLQLGTAYNFYITGTQYGTNRFNFYVEGITTGGAVDNDNSEMDVESTLAYYESKDLIWDTEEISTYQTITKNYTFSDYFSKVEWITRDGVVSLSIYPKSILTKAYANPNTTLMLASKSFDLLKAKYSSDTRWKNTTPMRLQYDCHVLAARGIKTPWNIEPHRTTTSVTKVIQSACNPKN
ncbi:DUF2599 domain-containing protein, partial [Neobacillus drentensis]|uniref:DUF2599 domain-containing protein n=1 Tax=Neobacillus drentensis TaxID=220684 RepID=UPI002FFDE8A6